MNDQYVKVPVDQLNAIIARAQVVDDGTDGADAESARSVVSALTGMLNAAHSEGETPALLGIPDECPIMIVFDDADRGPLTFAGAGSRVAAGRKWEQISSSWNAHLFVRVARNSRDDRYPSAAAIPVAQKPQAIAWQARFVVNGDDWSTCSREHFEMVRANPQEWPGYEVRELIEASAPALATNQPIWRPLTDPPKTSRRYCVGHRGRIFGDAFYTANEGDTHHDVGWAQLPTTKPTHWLDGPYIGDPGATTDQVSPYDVAHALSEAVEQPPALDLSALEKAKQQITGYVCGRNYSVQDLIDGMGLEVAEWKQIRSECSWIPSTVLFDIDEAMGCLDDSDEYIP